MNKQDIIQDEAHYLMQTYKRADIVLERGVPRVRIVNLAGLKGGGGTVFLSEPASASLTPRPDRWATIPLVTPGC